jgi:hypothetical protein
MYYFHLTSMLTLPSTLPGEVFALVDMCFSHLRSILTLHSAPTGAKEMGLHSVRAGFSACLVIKEVLRLFIRSILDSGACILVLLSLKLFSLSLHSLSLTLSLSRSLALFLSLSFSLSLSLSVREALAWKRASTPSLVQPEPF